MEDLTPFLTTVAFYLSDGTTARKRLDVPEGQDEVVYVRKILKTTRETIPVDSLDNQITRGGAELHIVPAHVVAFVVNP